MKVKSPKIILVFLVFVGLSFAAGVFGQESVEPPIPGQLSGASTYFEIKDSQYLNIKLTSSAEVKVFLESIPRMISLNIEAVSPETTSTTLVIENLEPNKTYYLYQDSYQNLAVFVSDENGIIIWQQDLTESHHIWLQETKSTVFITENMVLTADIAESVEISTGNITLDCDGHTITGNGTGYGIYINGKSDITIKNCVVSNFVAGINVYNSDRNNLIDNIVSNNYGYGIFLYYSDGNNLAENSFSDNQQGISLWYSVNNTLDENTSSNNVFYGISLYYSSNNNILTGNMVNSNGYSGFYLAHPENNTIASNNILNNLFGLYTYYANNNVIYNNNFIDNTSSASVINGVTNIFNLDKPTGGNYWSDYNIPSEGCFDSDNDGFCDNPYEFSGGQDNYPFIKENGWEAMPPAPEKWSFAIITDLHIGWGIPDYDGEGYDDATIGQEYFITERLERTIEWINNNYRNPDNNIKFVVVNGDITDTAEYSEFLKAREILNKLEIPYIPIIGNHDIWPYVQKITSSPDGGLGRWATIQDKRKEWESLGDEYFEKVFWQENATNTQRITNLFDSFERQEEKEDYQGAPYFQNYAFSYEGVDFISLDFAPRESYILYSPIASLPSETISWFNENLDGQKAEKIIVMTHYPFKTPDGFWSWDRKEISDIIQKSDCEIFDFAGHTHINSITSPEEVYDVIETEPVSQIPVRPLYNLSGEFIRLVQITANNAKEINYETLIDGFPSAINPYFIVNPGEFGAGDEVMFKAYTKNRKLEEILSYKWEFGDGTVVSGTGNEWAKVYQNSGKYKVNLMVTDIYGNSEELSWWITVKETAKKPNKIFLPIPGLFPFLNGDENVDLTQQANAQNTTEWALTARVASPVKPIGAFQVHFEQANEDIDLSNLTADVNLETKKSILYMDSWPAEVEESKMLYLPYSATGTVYICPNAASLEEINPRCSGKITLNLGETINGLALTVAAYKDQDYYLVLGFANGGGGVNLPPLADINGPYEGYGGLPVTFNAGDSIDPNNDFLLYRWDFDDDGTWDTGWLDSSKIDRIWNNDYEGIVNLEVSDGEFIVTATTSIKVKSPKAFKKEAIDGLQELKTSNLKSNKKIDKIIGFINQSLNEALWQNTSHLVFFELGKCTNLEKFLVPQDLDFTKLKQQCPKLGIMVFYYEKIAISLMKPYQEFKEVIDKLTEADYLLAKAALHDAKNAPAQNQKFQKIIEKQLELAEKELQKADDELKKGRPEKAILRFAKSWLHSQLAMKFAKLEE